MARSNLSLLLLSLGIVGVPAQEAHAIRLKVEQDSMSAVIAAVTKKKQDILDSERGNLMAAGKSAQLVALIDSLPHTVVLAYRIGDHTVSAETVLADPERFCGSNEALAYTGIRRGRASLQLKSTAGDNAAQSICIERE